MKAKISFVIFAVVFLFVFGVENINAEMFNSTKFTVEYSGLMRGQMITQEDVNSYENIHYLSLGYYPFSIVGLSAGAGVDKFVVAEYDSSEFKGQYGLYAGGAITLISPYLIDGILRFESGLNVKYLNSKDTSENLYYGLIYDPFLGIDIFLGKYFKIEAGSKLHVIDGDIKNTSTKEEYGGFSNRNIVRGYFNAVIKSPRNKSYLSFKFEVSPEFSSEWKSGPVESSVGIAFGINITSDRKSKKIRKFTRNVYFPNFDKVKKKAEKMESDINKD